MFVSQQTGSPRSSNDFLLWLLCWKLKIPDPRLWSLTDTHSLSHHLRLEIVTLELRIASLFSQSLQLSKLLCLLSENTTSRFQLANSHLAYHISHPTSHNSHLASHMTSHNSDLESRILILLLSVRPLP